VIPADCSSTDGGATQNQPAGGWNDARVSVYFGEQASFTSRTPTRSIPTPTVSPTRPPPPPPPPPPKPTPSHTGAIVGGVVGGVAFFILVFLLIWYCMKRRRTQPNQVPAAQSEKYSVSSPGPPSTVGSPSLPGHQVYPVYPRQSPPVGMPPPQPEYPYYLPGYGPPPMAYYPGYQFHPQPAYPPVDNRPPEVARATSHEMPTVKSPDVPDIIQPVPVRSEGRSSVS
jgi:hypothetical protein